MTTQLAIAIALHQLATLVWVGGMFFAHFALRGALQDLAPPQRLGLMRHVLQRFFVWVWLAIVVLWGSGLWIFSGVYNHNMGIHVTAMIVLGAIMTVLFVYLYFVPYPRFRAAVAAEDWIAAAAGLGVVRRIILTNLVLGLVTSGLGSAGRYF
jgi:uncharacterized membrane protein